jgi:hypothetical protein
MKSFSERLGYVKPVVIDEAPSWLRNGYANAVLEEFLEFESFTSQRVLVIRDLIEEVAVVTQRDVDRNYFNTYVAQKILEQILLDLTWSQFYEVVELVFTRLCYVSRAVAVLYQKKLNGYFEKGKVAWQMTSQGNLVRTLPPDITALETKLQSDDDLGEASKLHLRKARKFLDEKPCDATNAVKESISAIESFARNQPDGGKTLGSTLNNWKRNGRNIPPLLISTVEKLYAFANDEAGVRHGNPKRESLMRDDAEFVYLTSLAILRYFRVVE